jgi:glycerate kinase
VLQAARMQERLLDADLLVTGEGSMDSQTINGKTPVGVAKYAASANIPVIAISGQTRKGFESVYKAGIQAALSTTHEITTLEEALKHAKDDLYGTALIAARHIRIGQKQYRPAGPRPLE